MKRLNLVMLFTLLVITAPINNALAEVNKSKQITTITNIEEPTQTMGVRIGDVLTRKISILANTEEKITPKLLPVKGTRTAGIELSEVNLSQVVEKEKTQLIIKLRYQVFAHATQAEKMYLPKEVITLVEGEDLTIPAWSFWYSPLVNSDLDSAKTTILPQVRVSLIDQTKNVWFLIAFAGLFLLGVIGLIYINADRYWLPFMGGSFARAHRKIKVIAKKRAGDTSAPKEALGILHGVFNQLFGRGLYPNKIDEFVDKHPDFKGIKTEIVAFFELSNKTLFSSSKEDSKQLMQKILLTSQQFRNCERGV